MSRIPALLLLALAAALPARAETPERKLLTVTNGASRIVECDLLVDGKSRTQLKIHPGKGYADSFDPRRTLHLACMRTKEGVYRVKAGETYRFMDGERRIDLKAAADE
jgi:hypothetical protein